MTLEVRREVTLGGAGGSRVRFLGGLLIFSFFLSFMLVTLVCPMCENVLSIYLQYVHFYVHILYFD